MLSGWPIGGKTLVIPRSLFLGSEKLLHSLLSLYKNDGDGKYNCHLPTYLYIFMHTHCARLAGKHSHFPTGFDLCACYFP